jgi:hypothetical protein
MPVTTPPSTPMVDLYRSAAANVLEDEPWATSPRAALRYSIE